jgi:transposase
VNLYNNNISIRQISEDLECSISHVKNVLKRHNLYKPQKERSKLYLLLPYKETLLYLRFEKDMKFAALIRYVKQNYDIDVSLNHLREILNNWRKEENEGNQIK